MSLLQSSPSLADNPNITDWLDLSRTGVVVLKSGKVEIGQGIITALVQIAADELDVASAKFEVISGHTALGPTEAGTSSSLSIEVGGRAVRLAASAARQLLLAEAAKLLQAPIASLCIDNGRVHLTDRATDLTLWSLAQRVDLAQPVLDHANPKLPSERKLVGQPLARIDLAAKIAGPAFIHDINLVGMLHGRVVQPPSRSRRLVSFDESALREQYPDITIVRDGSFVGIIAEREDKSAKAVATAAGLVKWTAGGPGSDDLGQAIGFDSSVSEQIVSRKSQLPGTGRRIATEISRPYIAHASLAASCAIAKWQDGKLEVYSHSQAVHGLRTGLSLAFEIDANSIVVIHAPGAGTYGHNGQDDVAYEAALLARAVPGRPVRVLWGRAEDFALSPMGPGMLVRAEAFVSEAGRIEDFKIETIGQPHVHRPGHDGRANFIAAERLAEPMAPSRPSDVPLERGGGGDRNAVPLYAFPNVHVSKRILRDLPYRTSALRGLGAFANIFALETLMDDIAIEIDADPVQLRLDHLENARAAAVIRKAADMAGWPGSKREGEGLGLGFAQYKNRSAYCAVVVRVVIDASVRLTHAWSCVDAGEVINTDGVINQIEGAIVQSASWTLHEHVAFDGDTVATRDWESYRIMKFSEVPEIEVAIIARPEELALGVGEAATAPTSAAIGNAVRNALGTRVRTLPITREAVLAAIA